MLEVNQLARYYDDVKAVDGVTFAIDKGEIVGLLGHNGAGKTTVMKILRGYLEPDEGTVVVDDIDSKLNPKAIQQQLGYLPENLPVYPEMTVADYLDYAATLKGLNDKRKSAEVARVVKATAITDKFLSPIGTLSRGYKQRVGVAQAILGRPKLLILDEPTNGLDPEQTQYMRELIRELAGDATIILSTHIMQEVDALCSRALILRSGKLVLDSQLNELRQSRNLLLMSSLPEADMPSLEALEGIAKVICKGSEIITANKSMNHYCITLKTEADQHALSATITKHIVKKGWDVYALQAEQRNLETLFRQVNEKDYQQEESANVAG